MKEQAFFPKEQLFLQRELNIELTIAQCINKIAKHLVSLVAPPLCTTTVHLPCALLILPPLCTSTVHLKCTHPL